MFLCASAHSILLSEKRSIHLSLVTLIFYPTVTQTISFLFKPAREQEWKSQVDGLAFSLLSNELLIIEENWAAEEKSEEETGLKKNLEEKFTPATTSYITQIASSSRSQRRVFREKLTDSMIR